MMTETIRLCRVHNRGNQPQKWLGIARPPEEETSEGPDDLNLQFLFTDILPDAPPLSFITFNILGKLSIHSHFRSISLSLCMNFLEHLHHVYLCI